MNLLLCVDCVLYGIIVFKNIEYGIVINIIFLIWNFFSNFIFGELYILINFIIYMMFLYIYIMWINEYNLIG